MNERDFIAEAQAIIADVAAHEDPEAAMAELEADAPERDQPMFALLWEGLVHAMDRAGMLVAEE